MNIKLNILRSKSPDRERWKEEQPADGKLEFLTTEKTEEKEFTAPDDAEDNLEEVVTTDC